MYCGEIFYFARMKPWSLRSVPKERRGHLPSSKPSNRVAPMGRRDELPAGRMVQDADSHRATKDGL
jgi:hypothetical protein